MFHSASHAVPATRNNDRIALRPPDEPAASPAGDERASAEERQPRPRIVAIKNGKLGNDTHVLAIAHAVASWIDGEVDVFDARFRAPILAPLVRSILSSRWPERLRRSPRWWERMWRICFHGGLPEGPRPILVCGTLARGEIPNAFLSRYWQCESLHLGRPCRVPRGHFSAVIAPQGTSPQAGDLQLEIAPTRITADGLRRAGRDFRREHRLEGTRLWTMLIGGSGGGYRWNREDWDHLAAAFRTLAERHGVRWLITTSPRTGRDVEEQLRAALPGDLIGYGVWFSRRPERVVLPFLGAAERTFVTEESISMLSDALVAGKPVYAVAPWRPPSDPKAAAFVARHADQRRLSKIPVAELPGLHMTSEHDDWFRPLTEPWEEALRRQLLPCCPALQELAAKRALDAA